MVEKEATKEKEIELTGKFHYEKRMSETSKENERRKKARKVIKGKSIPWEASRQGFLRWYCDEYQEDAANRLWIIFAHDIRFHSGKHKHEGGGHLFVDKGKGYSVINGVRYDWNAGDLICLPPVSGGIEHQHFNLDSKPSRWIALLNNIKVNAVGHYIRQIENRPDWKKPEERK